MAAVPIYQFSEADSLVENKKSGTWDGCDGFIEPSPGYHHPTGFRLVTKV